MKYMLLMYASESVVPELPPEVYQDWITYMDEATAAGVLVGNGGLESIATATTLRVREGKTLITDGPFAETHEQLGGYSMLECENLDEALRWAAKVPTAKYGSIEIRPMWTPKQSAE